MLIKGLHMAAAGTDEGMAALAEKEAEQTASNELGTGLFPGKPGRSIHDRMPVILDAEGEYIWMKANASRESLQSVFKPYPSHLMLMEEMPPLPTRRKKGPELGLEF